MTATIVRLILAMLILPVTGAVFLLSFLASVPRNGPPSVLSLCAVWMTVYLVVATYWILLWRSTVRWTSSRIVRTIAVSAAALVCGCAVAFLCHGMVRGLPVQIAMLIGGGVVPILWVLGTVIVWRETHTERIERLKRIGATVVCPTCGYNMAGLKTATCPECGGAFTLDQFVAAQPREAQVN